MTADDSGKEDESTTNQNTDAMATLLAGGGTKKVIGQLSDTDGVGVYGYAKGSGTTCGVKGEVDSANGYGLATPDDAKIGGGLETTGDWRLTAGDQSTADAKNIVQGHASNSAKSSAVGITISGGGYDDGTTTEPNVAYDNYATVGGGGNNQAGNDDKDLRSGRYTTVSGGEKCKALPAWASVGGGYDNTASGTSGAIAGGSLNVASDSNSAIAGGRDNEASAPYSAVGGGKNNTASADYSTVPGGHKNTADGWYSLAAGRRAKATHDGSFVWADSTDIDFSSTDTDQFIIEAANGVGINQNSPTNPLHVTQDSNQGGSGLTSSYPVLIEMDADEAYSEVLALRTGYTSDPYSATRFLTCFDGNNNDLGGITGDGAGGITLTSQGSDYAEYMPRLDPTEEIESADIVGVVGDAVTKRTGDADQAMVVSDQAIVTGNSPDPGAEEISDHETVAFIGQVPVKVRGPVCEGDIVVPSGMEDGTGKAISPGTLRPDDGPIIGRAWERDDTEDVSEVTVAVGIDGPELFGEQLTANSERIEELEAENERLREALAEKDERINDLEARFAAIETQIGTTATPADD